jgi:hypothetical protein
MAISFMCKFVWLLPLLFLGAGCAQELGDTVAQPIEVPLAAHRQAVDVLGGVQLNQQAAMLAAADPVTVALILTEGHPAPVGVMVEGDVGCNDRVAYVNLPAVDTSPYPAEAALRALLAQREASVSGLHNALWQSTLEVDKVMSREAGLLEVWLKGEPRSAGACDTPRVKAQIERTVAITDPNFKIYLNDSESAWRCLGDESGECDR